MANRYDPNTLVDGIMDCYGGDRVLMALTLMRSKPGSQTYGVLDGAYRCQGDGNAAGNLITVGTTDHVVAQNTFRSGIGDYWALELE